jgi:hypothetical protein
MTYRKPEVNVLGDAAAVIEDFTKRDPKISDPVDPTSSLQLQAAYDLDE